MDKQTRKMLIDKCEAIDRIIKERIEGNPEPTDIEKATLIAIRNEAQELVSALLVV